MHLSESEAVNLIHVVGFVPWRFKYVNKQHPGVATEWKMVELLSAYNAYVDADACCIDAMTNAAFFSNLPLPERFVQQPPLSLPQLQQKNFVTNDTDNPKVVPKMYISFYVGDYDSAAWLYNEIKRRWDDSDRGSVPLGWAIDPELSWRFPVAFLYMMSTSTSNDRIICGDSGAGYVNPTQLLPPRVPSYFPSANSSWVLHNTPLYAQFDVRFTGFLINGDAGPLTEAAREMYASFSRFGVVQEFSGEQPATFLQNSMPVFSQRDLPPNGNVTQDAQVIWNMYNSSDPYPQFFVWRNVLQTPSYYKQLSEAIHEIAGDKIEIVDPLVLSALARSYLGADVVHQVTYIHETISTTRPYSSEQLTLNVTVRNDGWGNFSASDKVCVVLMKESQWNMPLKQRRRTKIDKGEPEFPPSQSPLHNASRSPLQPNRFSAVLANSFSINKENCVVLGSTVSSGKTKKLSLQFDAPSSTGTYKLTYQLFTKSGQAFQFWGNFPVDLYIHVNNDMISAELGKSSRLENS